MSDIETKVVISADTGDLQSGMAAAAAAVRQAIEAMRAQLAAIGATAGHAQTRVVAACGQIGSATRALHGQVASLAAPARPPAAAAGDGGSDAPDRQSAKERERQALAELDAEASIDDAELARKKAAIEAERQLGQISAAQETAQLQAQLDDKWALDESYFEKKRAAAAGDAQMQQKLLDEERLAYEKYLTDKQRLDTQSAAASQRAWQSAFQPIERAFDGSITGMIMGTTSLQKAVANIGQSIVGEFLSMAVKMLTQWVATELGMTAASQAGAAARTAAEGEGLVASLALKAVTAVKNIVSDAAQTFAGVFAFLAPLMGPAAAGPAAAASASVTAMTGAVASAAGGWVVPSDQLAMVHQNEMILPANLSQGLQGMIAGGGGGGVVNLNVSAIDAASFRSFVMSRSDVFAAAIAKASRGFNPALAGSRL